MIGRTSAKDCLSEKKISIPTPKPPKDSAPPSNNPPYNPNSPTNPNQLQFTVKYHIDLGPNHMYYTSGGLVKVILIDKENSIFLNEKLTKKGSRYTVTFLDKDAEKYENQSHVYYFSKNNNKFTLKPEQKSPQKPKTEMKFVYSGKCDKNEVAFNNLCEKNVKREDMRIFYISQNHPRIKELLKEGKLQAGKKKEFIIRYGKVDEISKGNLMYSFNEFNRELEITEA